MAVRKYNPISNGRRGASVQDFSDITATKPQRSLVENIQKRSGRNNTGRITVRHRGGGVKRLYRIIDFKCEKYGVPGKIVSIEYDPNRGPRIALVEYADATKAYIIAAEGMKVGMEVLSSKDKIEAKIGNRMHLEYIPTGLFVYNVEIMPGKGGQLVRTAGSSAQLQVIEGKYAQLKMPSGEVRLVPKECSASIGCVSNSDYKLVRLGKAGRMRKKGWRPTVRGKAMNPVDHPHGGGEGRQPIGLKKGPKTPWGKKALGVKTRKADKWTNKLIISRRKKNR
jgi:large subunit ribosomal protein L2